MTKLFGKLEIILKECFLLSEGESKEAIIKYLWNAKQCDKCLEKYSELNPFVCPLSVIKVGEAERISSPGSPVANENWNLLRLQKSVLSIVHFLLQSLGLQKKKNNMLKIVCYFFIQGRNSESEYIYMYSSKGEMKTRVRVGLKHIRDDA